MLIRRDNLCLALLFITAVIVLNHIGKTHLLLFDRQQSSSRTSRKDEHAIKNTTRMGGDFFRLPEASAAQFVRTATDADYLCLSKRQEWQTNRLSALALGIAAKILRLKIAA
jgi:hypothetical protein